MLSPFCLDSGTLYLCLLASGHIVPDFVHHAPVVNGYYFSGIVYCPSTLGSWGLCKSPDSSVKCNPSSVLTLLRPIQELPSFE